MSEALDLRTRWQVGRVHPTPDSEPKGWTLRRLCEVAKLESGHTPSRKRPDYWDGDIPWLSLHDSKEIEGKEIFETQHTVSKLGLDNSSARLLPKGTVALSRTATIGKVAILGREMATSQDFACYICGPDLLNHYLAHLFRGMETEWDRLMAGSTHNTIYMPLFESMQVLVPPLPEQRAIAAALSDADGVVAGLERVIAKKRLIKQGAMQDLLTARRRLPGFSGQWEPVNLARESHLRARIGWQGLTTNEYRDSGEYHLITGTEITDGRVDWRRCVFVDKWRYDQDRNIQLRNGDVLLTKDGTIGKVAQVRDLPGPAALNSGVFVIRPKSEAYDATFLFHVLRSAVFDTFLAKLTAGSTIVHLYQKDLVTFEFLAPGIAEQRAIAEALDDMDTEIQTLESRLAKARAVKEGMMQNLLTGRVRLV